MFEGGISTTTQWTDIFPATGIASGSSIIKANDFVFSGIFLNSTGIDKSFPPFNLQACSFGIGVPFEKLVFISKEYAF